MLNTYIAFSSWMGYTKEVLKGILDGLSATGRHRGMEIDAEKVTKTCIRGKISGSEEM